PSARPKCWKHHLAVYLKVCPIQEPAPAVYTCLETRLWSAEVLNYQRRCHNTREVHVLKCRVFRIGGPPKVFTFGHMFVDSILLRTNGPR
ncbi:unnamed protein product, partial [Porites lobata]